MKKIFCDVCGDGITGENSTEHVKAKQEITIHGGAVVKLVSSVTITQKISEFTEATAPIDICRDCVAYVIEKTYKVPQRNPTPGESLDPNDD